MEADGDVPDEIIELSIRAAEAGMDVAESVLESLPLQEIIEAALEGVGVAFDAIEEIDFDEIMEDIEEDLEDLEDVISEEELEELKAEVGAGDKPKTEAEFGDLLFSLINYSRFVEVNPEDALERTNKKFIHRFQYMEKALKKEGKDLSEMSLEEMDVYWEKAKKS